jgi:hypothetical protein
MLPLRSRPPKEMTDGTALTQKQLHLAQEYGKYGDVGKLNRLARFYVNSFAKKNSVRPPRSTQSDTNASAEPKALDK